MELADTRKFIWNVFGDSEVWVDAGETPKTRDIFVSTAERMFRDRNFDVFYVVPAMPGAETMTIAFRPAKGMHRRLWDPMEGLPNIYACKEELWVDPPKVAVYRPYTDEGDERYGILECNDYVLESEFLRDHPNAVDLLPK
jgi:hypothetical protein